VLRKAAFDGKRLERARVWLGDAVFDPALWPQIDEIKFAESAKSALTTLPRTRRGVARPGAHPQ
jgi:hypothetical protein